METQSAKGYGSGDGSGDIGNSILCNHKTSSQRLIAQTYPLLDESCDMLRLTQ